MVRPMAKVVMLTALAAGCAGLPRSVFESPTVDLVSVDITGLGLTGGSLQLHMDVYNPNAYEIRSTRLEASIDLEETHFGDVALDRALRLAAGETTRVEVPVSFTWTGVGAGARSLLTSGAVRYLLTGTMLLATPLGDRGVEVRTGGDVSLRDLVR